MSQQSEIFARYRSLFNSKSVKPTENEYSKKYYFNRKRLN